MRNTGSRRPLDYFPSCEGLFSVTDTSYSDTVEALNGGTVNLNTLQTMTANVNLVAQDNGSVLNIPELNAFSVGSGFIAGGASLSAEDGGRIEVGDLTELNSVPLTVDGTNSFPTDQLTSFTNATLRPL
jgi:hypothetical protein